MDTMKILLGATIALLLAALVMSWNGMRDGVKNAPEEEIARMRKQLDELRVETERIQLEKQLQQARADGGTDSDNILGDVMESLLGAQFIDNGFAASRDLVHQLWRPALESGAGESKHPKSALQEWAAGNRRKMPEYRLVDRSGPDHAAKFTVAVGVKGVGEVEATGSSKQEAETLAAAAFMERFG